MNGTALGRVVGHVRRLWPGAGVWLTAPFIVWPIFCLVTGQFRVEHVVMFVALPLLAYTNAATRRLFLGFFPMALLGLIYDAMRPFDKVGLTTERIHLCDLRAIDMRIASVTVGGTKGSVHDWLQSRPPSAALDLLFAIPYGTFLFVTVLFAVVLFWKDEARMRVFGWSFLTVNLAGFVTYHLYPAAPPWYFHAHGCVVDMTSRASEGPNLARVDALLGVPYFHALYGRSSDVFGAIPSLHVGYPMLILLAGWPVLGRVGRTAAVLFLVAMCSAAVYLDHHWIVDVLIGIGYASLGHSAVAAVAARSKPKSLETRAAEEATEEAAE